MTTLPRTPSFRLDGKRALVTGGSSGIGLGCAAALAGAGAEVTLAARGIDRLDAVRDAFARDGQAVATLALDIADPEAVRTAVAGHGPFDVAVNSAGLARHGPATDTGIADFHTVMAVNTTGAYFLAQAVARGLIAAGRPGSIIFLSSQMAHVGGLDRAVYCGSKHALEGFQKAMAMEWGRHGIRVNSICPTFIRTPLTEPTFADPERVDWIRRKIKLGRVGTVEDIMGATLFLASDAAALVTGTSILVDGGWTAG